MEQSRPETGPMQFGDDWTGTFIRGDNAFGYTLALRGLLNKIEEESAQDAINYIQIESLVRLLSSSDERNTSSKSDRLQKLKSWEECILPENEKET